MLISSSECRPTKEDSFQAYHGTQFDIYWKGLLYVPEYQQGVPSIAHFEELVVSQGVPAAAARLKGVFVCMVCERDAGKTHVFVDNAGLRGAFKSAKNVSTSFLELIRSKRDDCQGLSLRSVIEYLELGGVYHNRTQMSGVSAIARDEVVTLLPGQPGHRSAKKLHIDVTEEPALSRDDFFRTLAKALSGMSVHVELTGGVDSRYTAAMLKHYGLDFSVGLASRPDHRDAVISEMVARQLNVPHRVVDQLPRDLDEGLRNAFEWVDGLGDPVALLRPLTYCETLKQASVDVNIFSIGETFKDWIWYQDFPFYGTRQADFSRLFRYRVAPMRVPKRLWHPDVVSRVERWETDFLREMEVFRYDTNTRSYDAFIAFGKGQASISAAASARARLVDTVVPYFDLDLLRDAYRMNPWNRVFDLVYRKDLTRVQPAVAKLRTTDGLTVSAKRMDMAADSVRIVQFFGRRLLKVLGRKLFRKSFFQPTADRHGYQQQVRSSPLLVAGMQRLKELQILAPDARSADIGSRAGRVISLGLLLEQVGDAKIAE